MFTLRNLKLISAITGLVTLMSCWPVSTYAGRDDLQQPGIKPDISSSAPRQNQDPASTDTRTGQAKEETVRSIPDVEVINQYGKKVHFYSDLVKDRIVIVSFFYTTCQSICLMQGEHLGGLQELLGDRLGKDVNIISISSDPQTDTPDRVKDWAARFKAKPGWTVVTGGTAEIDQLAKAFTQAGSSKGMHSPIVYLGNDKKGLWFNANGLVGRSRWMELMAEVSR